MPFIEPRPWFAARRRSVRIRSTIARKVVDLVLAWRENARQRRVLAALDERMLRDIGINRLEVAREARKPFWRS